MPPNANACEKMTLCVPAQVVGLHVGNRTLVNITRR